LNFSAIGCQWNPAAVLLDHQIRDVEVAQIEAEIRLVVAVFFHRLVELQPRKVAARVVLVQIDAEPRFPDREDQAFDQLKQVVLVDEAELDVDLGELGLAIDAQIFVAEAAHDLKIAIEAGHHEQLLEQLRALGEGVELGGVQS